MIEMSETKVKQKVDIKVSFSFDQYSAQEEYDRLTDISQYLKKGFSEQQARYFNRYNQSVADKINNDHLYLVGITVKADVYNSNNGKIEEYSDHLGGCYYDPYNDDLDTFNNDDYLPDMINELKHEIQKDGIDLNDLEFTIIKDDQITY